MDKSKINDLQNRREKARLLFEKGAEAWKNGKRAEAISLYSESADLDPDGPGAQALEMSNRIMDFYDKQQFNP